MFNLFKTEQPTSEIIEKIHNEFETAGEKLLQEALEIVKPNKFLLEKAEKLKMVGFKNSVEVKKAVEVKVSEDVAKMVEMYQRHYPENKFITEEQVKTINKKYGLVCAPIDRYTGFVPAQKLELIMKFRFMDGGHKRKNSILVKKWEYSFDDEKDKQKRLLKQYPNSLFPGEMFDKGYSRPSIKGDGFSCSIREYEEVDLQSKFICAPKNDMNMDGLGKYGELYATSKSYKYVPDPVVLQPVKGGFLILAAWGDESSDPIVVNQQMN